MKRLTLLQASVMERVKLPKHAVQPSHDSYSYGEENKLTQTHACFLKLCYLNTLLLRSTQTTTLVQ